MISGSVKYDPEPLEPAAAGNLWIYCSRPGKTWEPTSRAKSQFEGKKRSSRVSVTSAPRPVFMLRVISRLVRPEFLVVIEIVAAKA